MSTETEERLRRIEQRLEAVERAIAKAEALVAQFTAGAGKKLLASFGIRLP